MNNKRFSWKNCCSHTLKFKLEREISWWQTHKQIILMITGRTARLRLEIYPETGWDVMTCYSHNTEILNTYAMKSWLFSCGVMFTGQTHLNKGNFPYNLDNTLSIVQFPFWNKHCHPEQCSSKRATEQAIIILHAPIFLFFFLVLGSHIFCVCTTLLLSNISLPQLPVSTAV